MGWVAPGERRFRFVVSAVTTEPTRGTLAIGTVQDGEVHVGDRLMILHGDRLGLVTCRGTEGFFSTDDGEALDPKTLGLWFSALSADDIGEGDEIVSSERVSDDA
jgi:hypothetical protein